VDVINNIRQGLQLKHVLGAPRKVTDEIKALVVEITIANPSISNEIAARILQDRTERDAQWANRVQHQTRSQLFLGPSEEMSTSLS
jgi:hypothetical protein